MNQPALPSFEIGKLYSNEEIHRSLQVGNAGGVRAAVSDEGTVRRLVVMTSVPTARQRSENPYCDRMEGNILVYTGAGRKGDQLISGPNARILQQPKDRFPIYGFVLLESRRKQQTGAKRWAFLGLMEFLRSYREHQFDSNGVSRLAWVFELRVRAEIEAVPLKHDSQLMATILNQSDNSGEMSSDDRLVVNPQEREPEQDLAAIEAIRSRLLGYEPRAFESLLQSLLLQSGFERVEVTQFSQDGGIDLNAYPGPRAWPVRDLLIQIQAKRWLHTVGRKEVAELRGSLQRHARGCVVTTSHFSRAAVSESKDAGKMPIVLIDGFEMAKTISVLGLDLPTVGPK